MPTADKDIVVKARLDRDILGQLDELAAEMQRSRSYLIAEAVREFVELEYPHLRAVRQAEADFEAGRYYTHEEALKWVADLKAGRAPKLPVARKRRPA